jgi:hypothetical protein
MYLDNNYDSLDQSDYINPLSTQVNLLEDIKKKDRGYNVIYRMVERPDGVIKKKKIEIYTTGDMGNRIRDAETGEYYKNLVGTKDEDLFFKVALATGECKSSNSSNSLFYLSPKHYTNHLHCSVSDELVENWDLKRNIRLKEVNSTKKLNIV